MDPQWVRAKKNSTVDGRHPAPPGMCETPKKKRFLPYQQVIVGFLPFARMMIPLGVFWQNLVSETNQKQDILQFESTKLTTFWCENSATEKYSWGDAFVGFSEVKYLMKQTIPRLS